MAGYGTAGLTAGEGDGDRIGAPQADGEADGDADIDSDFEQSRLAGLPGVVNDLPEVAPHEWIYLMS